MSDEFLKIEKLINLDQEAILKFKRGEISSEDLQKINLENQTVVKDYIKKYGFPFKNTTSENAYKAAFLVIAHSGNTGLLRDTIDIFEDATEEEIDKRDIAILVDKFLITQNLPQRYGTQFRIKNGSISFLPIEDRSKVDQLRAKLGLVSLEEYTTHIKENYR